MNDLNNYKDQIIEHSVVDSDPNNHTADASMSELIIKIIRRWYVVLGIFVVVVLVGVPAIWLVLKPTYTVSGAIRVAPIMKNVLSGEAERGEMGKIEVFMNTQAQIITSNRIVQGVADDLITKDLNFFKEPSESIEHKLKKIVNGNDVKPEISAIIKQAISNGVISAQTRRNTELIEIAMTSDNPAEAKQIVDSFIREYMAVEVLNSTKDDDQNLNILLDEQKIVAEKMAKLREDIHQLAQEYGDTKLDTRHQMKLDRIATLFASLTQFEADRIRLEVKVKLLEENGNEQSAGPEEMLQARSEFINSDQTVTSLAANIEKLEQDLIVARQLLTATNPEIIRKEEQVKLLNERLETLKEDVGSKYDKLVEERTAKNVNADLESAKAELEATRMYEETFKEMLSKEDLETRGLGRKQLDIEALQDSLAFAEEHYANVTRRIKDLELERKRPARISVAYNAEIAEVSDKRLKLTLANIFGALACGIGAAFLLSKADKSVYAAGDLKKHVSVNVIGTTTCIDRVNETLRPKVLVEDFQTIRANISLLLNNGSQHPKVLVVTSPGSGDGKTTMAINLATSLAKSGKKVLLMDGDMRKPDVAKSLNLPKHSRGLQDFLFGQPLEKAACHIPSLGLDVLASDSINRSDAYELLANRFVSEYMKTARQLYDHIIIDTPPVLAFPDALIWAKMADAAILASYSGRTRRDDLNLTCERLEQINVKVLGAVMNNVRVGRGYYQYGYNSYSKKSNGRKNNGKSEIGSHLLAAHIDDPGSE